MRPAVLALSACAAMLASCGPKALSLPDDPIARAATCGVVAAASARAGSAVAQAPLAFADQGHVMHYAMLAGAQGDRFDQAKAAAVVKRMSDIESGITEAAWPTLVEPCKAAFPQAQASGPIALPRDPVRARLGCYMLSDFLTSALRSQRATYRHEMDAYDALERDLDVSIGKAMTQRGGVSFGRMQEVRLDALAAAVKLGPPMAVMDACLKRYG